MTVIARIRAQRGVAAVELLAAVPLVCALATGVGQLAFAGYAQWQLHEAARDAARASHVVAYRSGSRAAERAATRIGRDALAGLGSRLRLRQRTAGDVVLTLDLPLLPPYRQITSGKLKLRAHARFGR